MTEETKTEEPKKTWRVCLGVLAKDLESFLNELSNDGYQIYKTDRYEEYTAGARTGLEPSRHGCTVYYDVVAFDPSLVSMNSSKSLLDTISKLTGQQFPTPGAPLPKV